jgi:hypothetical protein
MSDLTPTGAASSVYGSGPSMDVDHVVHEAGNRRLWYAGPD